MTAQSPMMMRCERCRAAISTTEATELIRLGVRCGVCGGTLTLCGGGLEHLGGDHGDGSRGDQGDGSRPSSERRLIGVLREAEGRPVAPQALTQAGIHDPASAIYELECAGYRIERAYGEASIGRRRFLGYRLWQVGQQSSGGHPARG